MLFALKQLYSFSICVIKFQGELSDSFRMDRGVRQGAASSVLLFNSFMDDLFKYLDDRCSAEALLGDIHSLVHADDTIIVSTDRASFIKKCDQVVMFFTENRLRLNLGKSAYLIINPKEFDTKSTIVLSAGVLKYKSEIEYLGVYVTDSGSLKKDIQRFVDKKRANVSIKYTNFCKANRNAPLHVKLDVLETCVAAALTYGCETWGNYCKEADLCHRSGLKTALNVRQCLNNEIVYIETGKWPLHCRIKKSQLKFWLYIKDYTAHYPNSAISKVLQLAHTNNIPYVRYYDNLESTYIDPVSCQSSIEADLRSSYTNLMRQAREEDENSRLGTYIRVNPSLQSFVPNPQHIMEIERELTTRYRTGSHSLAIERGRYSNIPRENRLCSCGTGIQTVWHLFSECPVTRGLIGDQQYGSLEDVFTDDDVHRKLLLMCKELKIDI